MLTSFDECAKYMAKQTIMNAANHAGPRALCVSILTNFHNELASRDRTCRAWLLLRRDDAAVFGEFDARRFEGLTQYDQRRRHRRRLPVSNRLIVLRGREWCRATLFGDGPPPTFTVEDLAARKADQKERSARAEEEEAGWRAVQAKAQRCLRGLRPADPSHPYLTRKKVRSHGLLQMHDLLAVPLKNSDGEVWNAQFISPEGKKRYFKQGRKRGLAFRIGTPGKFAVIVLAKGYATGASIFEATGLCVIVTFDKGNMLLVARSLRAKYPDARLLLAADDDRKLDGSNPGLTAAKAAAARWAASSSRRPSGLTGKEAGRNSTTLHVTSAPTPSGHRSWPPSMCPPRRSDGPARHHALDRRARPWGARSLIPRRQSRLLGRQALAKSRRRFARVSTRAGHAVLTTRHRIRSARLSFLVRGTFVERADCCAAAAVDLGISGGAEYHAAKEGRRFDFQQYFSSTDKAPCFEWSCG